MSRAEPVSRRSRPAKAPLTRRSIVETAVRVMEAAGTDHLTLRKVAGELDTGPASLYVYFRNVEELYAAVLEHYLGSLDLPVSADGDARQCLVKLLTEYTNVLFAHPDVARIAAFTRPSGPNYLRLLDALLGLMIAVGVPPRDAAWGVDLLLLYATTNAVEQSARKTRSRSDEEDAALNYAVGELVRKTSPEHPHLIAVGDELFSGEGEERLAWGFDVLINGFMSTPRPGPRDSGVSPPAERPGR